MVLGAGGGGPQAVRGCRGGSRDYKGHQDLMVLEEGQHRLSAAIEAWNDIYLDGKGNVKLNLCSLQYIVPKSTV